MTLLMHRDSPFPLSTLCDEDRMDHFLDQESFPDSLRYLHWQNYPSKSLPSQFSPKNLVELHMPYSKLQRLWNEGQNPENLKRIDLQHSWDLVEIPDLSKSENIESINLEGCRFVQVPSTLWSLNKLVELNLGRCEAIKNFPRSYWKLESLKSLKLQGTSIVNIPISICKMKFLEELHLSHCWRFRYFPEISEPMEHLKVLVLRGMGIKQLPKSIGNLVALKLLDLWRCSKLVSVPQSIYKLNFLEKLSIRGCWKLTKLPSSSIILWPRICDVDLRDCGNLEEIPDGLFSLASLKSLNLRGTLIESIPPLVQLIELTSLDISYCKRLQSLPEVPCLLDTLDANGCRKLKTVSFSMIAITQGSDQIDRSFQPYCVREEKSWFFNSLGLDKNARSNIMNDAQLRIMRMATLLSKRKDINRELFKYKSCPVSVICPGNKIPKWFSDQTEGPSININLPPDWCDENFLGFALCAVGTVKRYELLSITCRYNFKFNNGQCQGYEVQLESTRDFCDGALSPDHEFVWYHPFIFNDTEWCTEASFEFCSSVVNHNPMLDETYVEKSDVKRCGVGLLYAQGQDAAVAVKAEVK